MHREYIGRTICSSVKIQKGHYITQSVRQPVESRIGRSKFGVKCFSSISLGCGLAEVMRVPLADIQVSGMVRVKFFKWFVREGNKGKVSFSLLVS
jgi:hypothetical protein